ncbi:hypothetical protein ES319_A04G158100v1 [Gossypium barbadense]|uniref:TF-B3 domain-containing protein n=1 Tax=Gossypium barbadense TaxID=3634 RepID=A0A5J5W8D0_GOSBA|nr:hypothetical protein ES319_A04G158100v1 [Gossypium barbadense]
MEVIINNVVLEAHHVRRWKFCDHSRTLPGEPIVLTVTEDGNERWQFECSLIEGGMHCIRCPAWSDFVGPRINARLTLYAKQDGKNFHRMRVIVRRN